MENRMLSSKPWRGAAFAAALLASTAMTGLAAQAQPGPVNPPATEPTQPVLPDFTALVSRVKPAVVSITTTLGAQPDDPSVSIPLPFPFNQMVPHGSHA